MRSASSLHLPQSVPADLCNVRDDLVCEGLPDFDEVALAPRMLLLDGIEYAARDGVSECPATAEQPVVAGDRTDLRPEAARQLVVHSRAYLLDDAPEIGAVAAVENSEVFMRGRKSKSPCLLGVFRVSV